MPDIKFEKSTFALDFLNPFKGFQDDEHVIEVRRDPLLGDISIYNPALKDKSRFLFGEIDYELVKKTVADSAKNCIFCEGMLEKSTTKYKPDLIPEGRIRAGEAILFPNLYPLGKYHSVIVLCRSHFLTPSQFAPGIVADGLRAALEFTRRVYEKDRAAAFVTVNANYLFPSGATLVHPHMQMLVTEAPYSYQERLIGAGRSYMDENGTVYFDDLIISERKEGARYIARAGEWHWISAYSPTGSNEILAIHEREGDFGELPDADLKDLAAGISKVLGFYESLGLLSFNYSLLSVRDSRKETGFRCLLKMISRQNPYPNYRNDDYFLQKILRSELIITLPEELAPMLRGYFISAPEAGRGASAS